MRWGGHRDCFARTSHTTLPVRPATMLFGCCGQFFIGGPMASLTIARKLARRSYHILRALGPAALDPPSPPNKRSVKAQPSSMPTQRAASSRSDRGTRADAVGTAAHERHSGRSRSTGTTDQPSRHRPPTAAAAGPDKAGRPRSKAPVRQSTAVIRDQRATPHANTPTPTSTDHGLDIEAQHR
jgi:hypothetical protein